MNENQSKFNILIGLFLALISLLLVMQTCALDRLEQQMIATRQAVEKGGGGGGTMIIGGGGSIAGEPGASSGMTAVGWGDDQAEILFVEGAVSGAPLTLGQKPKPQGDAFINRRTSPPGSLNYYTTNEGDASTVTKYIYGTLMEMNPDKPQEALPNLATSWSVSEDQLVYTYNLRRGVQFADGRHFTSRDVKWTFEAMRDPQVQADHLRSNFDDVVSVETPDDYTVVVTYSKKYWKGLYSFGVSLRILNSGWYEAEIPRYAEELDIANFSTTPGKPGFGEVFNKIRIPCPGAGPYYFADPKYEPDDGGVSLIQNPFYFGIQTRPEHYNLEELRWVYISDPVAAFEAFRKETFDITVVDFQPWDDEYSSDPTITEISDYYEYDHMALGFSFIAWNNRQAPFDDPRVRRAMTHLTNRAWILEEIERGRGSIAVANSKRIYETYSDLEPLPFDIEAARALLAEAGWTDSDGDGVLDRNGERFEFEFKVGSQRRFYVQVTEALKDACAKVGIRMTVRNLEWSTFIEDFYERRFDAVCLYNSWADPWIDLYDEYHSSQDIPRGGNAPGWHNDRADELLEAMREEFDDAARTEMFHEFNQIFQDEQPLTLLVHGKVGVLVHERFEEARVRPTGFRVFELWVEPENVKYE